MYRDVRTPGCDVHLSAIPHANIFYFQYFSFGPGLAISSISTCTGAAMNDRMER